MQSATRRRSPPERLVDVGFLGRAAQRLHRHLDLLLQVPQVQPVHFVLELCRLVRRLVGVVHHQLVVALDDRRLLDDAFHHVAEHVLRRVELRLLGQVADRRALGQPGFAGVLLVEPGHDLEHVDLPEPLGPKMPILASG